jgi:hypothetical protein
MSQIISGPEWAYGCGECSYGLALDAPLPRNGMTLAEVRRSQHNQGIIAYCECQAGQARQRWAMGKPPEPQPSHPVGTARRRDVSEWTSDRAEELREVYA